MIREERKYQAIVLGTQLEPDYTVAQGRFRNA